MTLPMSNSFILISIISLGLVLVLVRGVSRVIRCIAASNG